MKTLIVEDDEGTRLFLQTILQSRQHEVAAFGAAEAAWTRYEKEFFPLVIVDATIDAWLSPDNGKTWTQSAEPPVKMASNPPSMVRLPDSRIVLTYGYRYKPFGIRARVSADEGRTWSPEIVLRDDALTGDLGYPRSYARPDGKVVTIYYYNGPRDEDRAIEATVWKP